MSKACRKCNTALVSGDNWYPSNQRRNNCICKQCVNFLAQEWSKKHNYEAHRSRTATGDELISRRAQNRVARAKYLQSHPHARSIGRKQRRLLQKENTPIDFDKGEVDKLYMLAEKLSIRFGRKFEVDHVLPLSKGGSHHHSNMVVMCAALNRAKANKVIPPLIHFFLNNQ